MATVKLTRLLASEMARKAILRVGVDLITIHFVGPQGNAFITVTTAGAGQRAFFETAQGLAEEAVTRGLDIPELTSGRICNYPEQDVVGPRLDGAAICLYEAGPPYGRRVLLGAMSLIGAPAAQARAAMREVARSAGFQVDDMVYPGDPEPDNG